MRASANPRCWRSGEIDFTLHFSPLLLIPIDAGEKITIIAGVHVGCFELFANERIRSIADLKGKTVGVPDLGASPHVFLSTMAAHVGLDPAKDINWVTSPIDRAKGAFRRGQDRCVPRLSARAAGTARPQDRPRDRQQLDRPPLVAVLLLHAGGQPGLRPQESGRDQARAARHPQGDRLLRQRSGRVRRGAWSMAASPLSTTMRSRR